MRCPSLVVHGTADDLIRFSDARKLFDALPEPKHHHWIEGAGHNDLFTLAGSKILEEVVEFEHSLPADPLTT